MSRPAICIKPQKLNIESLEIREPKVYKPRDINLSIKTSEILYRNNKGELCDLYITLPQIETYGPSPINTFNSKIKSKENIQGYTISYSHLDVEKMFDSIHDDFQNKINEIINNCKLKPIFNYRKKLENNLKVDDKSKPKVAYLKLKISKDCKIIETKMYDPNSKQLIDPIDTISKFGLIKPMIHMSNIYFGSHGNSGYSASVQVKLVKAYFQQISSELPDFPDEE